MISIDENLRRLESSEKVTIDKHLFNQLQDDSRMLFALKRAGVDNWDGYDYAMDDFNDAPCDEYGTAG